MFVYELSGCEFESRCSPFRKVSKLRYWSWKESGTSNEQNICFYRQQWTKYLAKIEYITQNWTKTEKVSSGGENGHNSIPSSSFEIFLASPSFLSSKGRKLQGNQYTKSVVPDIKSCLTRDKSNLYWNSKLPTFYDQGCKLQYLKNATSFWITTYCTSAS